MKYKIRLIILCLSYQVVQCSLENYTNQVFMFTRPLFNSVGMQQASWCEYGYNPRKLGTSIQVYPAFAQSFPEQGNTEYFLFDFKRELLMRGGLNATNYTLTSLGFVPNGPLEDQIGSYSYQRDILGQWFDFNTTENALFTVEPEQTQAAMMLEINQDIKKIMDCSFVDRFYATIRVPVTYVRNNFGLRGDKKAIAALTDHNFAYANFPTCEQKSVRLTNVQLILGTKLLNENDCMVITGTGVVIPLVEQDTNRYLFQPLNGYDAHLGLTGLVLLQFPLIHKNDAANSRLCFFFEFENNFLARNFQMRTYDLRGKPYSRYMKLLDKKLNEIVPATNALTIRSRVEPFNIFNMATGLRLKYKNCITELGYELWAHGSEVVTPQQKLQWDNQRYGIAFINDKGELAKLTQSAPDSNIYNIEAIDTTTEAGQTASQSTINYVSGPDGVITSVPKLVFNPQNSYIDLEDLDDFSCAARASIVNRAYLTIGWGEKGRNRDMFVNIGLYIEASQNNAALSMWGTWAKMGIAF